MIPAVMERCAGIDVGKKFLAVCVMTGPANEEARRRYGSSAPFAMNWRRFGRGASTAGNRSGASQQLSPVSR